MADEYSAAPASATAEQAMNRVLAAEQDAVQAIAVCEARARDIVQAAREQANRITSRTDQRITLMQSRCAQCLVVELGQLRGQIPDGGAAGETLDDASISACMEGVAATLTCVGPERET